ncbi:ATP-binding protein [Nocardioides sp. URHA0032]|uniref:ATP-binding protein n=1 Tax=Nocardioides sp. URHA0032 TaxID=1380388 RepID=UPI0006851CCD|nr:ATP-binding protein [Nocardioides sp. URHA0032]
MVHDPVDSVDSVASAALRELVGIPGVRRAAIALSEGGGRRLRFRSSDGGAWCHIDAYDDVPLTTVVRTGRPLLDHLDGLRAQFAGVVERQRADGTVALAALPLPGRHSPIGGVVLYFDVEQAFDAPQRGLLDAVAHRIAESVRRVRSAVAHDDLTQRATLRLEDDPRAAGRARQFLRGLLTAWQVRRDVADTAELCVSELVTNAVIHAGTGSVLTVSLAAGVLDVQVRDHGADTGVALVDDEDPLRVFGRGLQLVAALADRWGADHDDAGTTSWFSLEVGAPAFA